VKPVLAAPQVESLELNDQNGGRAEKRSSSDRFDGCFAPA